MKIDSIYINSFGGLKKININFNDGFNVIFGKNENGKTTVMQFIKCMFYGTGSKSKKGIINESIREKYTPWDGSQMGGRIFFTHKNTSYCLEREFRKSDSTDKITLTNKDTGELLPAVNSIGEEFFHLTQKAFERSVFIDNNVSFTGDEGAEADFNAKLSSITSSGDIDISHDKILKKITSARNKVLSSSNKAGPLAADIKKRDELCELLTHFEDEAKEKNEIIDKIAKLDDRLYSLTEEYDKTKKITDRESDFKNAQKLRDLLITKAELDKIESGITDKNGNVLNINFFNAVKLGIENCDKHREKLLSIKEDYETLSNDLEELKRKTPANIEEEHQKLSLELGSIDKKRYSVQAETENKKAELSALEDHLSEPPKRINTVFLILGIVALIPAVSLGIFSSYIYISLAIAVIAVLMLVLSVVKKKNADNSECVKKIATVKDEIVSLKDEINSLSEQKAAVLEKLSSLNTFIQSRKAVIAQKSADLDQKSNSAISEEEALKKATEELIRYFSKYKDIDSVKEIKNEIRIFFETNEKEKELKTKLTLIQKDLNNIDYEDAKQKLKDIESGNVLSDREIDIHKNMLESLLDEISECKEQITALQTELKTGFRDFIEPTTIKRQIDTISETIVTKKDFCNACDIAVEVLTESAQSMRKSYGSDLENSAQEIFSQLTGGKYSTVTLTKGLGIRAEQTDSFGMHDIEYLSTGTVNQAYLSLRLAISSMLSKDEPLPVMLDDALSEFDDDRLYTALEYLKERSVSKQMVLFTCHGIIVDKAEKLGANIVAPF